MNSKIDLATELDFAIRNAEIKKNSTLTYGYEIKNTRIFENYLHKDCFDNFKATMNQKAKDQFGKGGGSELKERKNKNGVVLYPPKMASFGSSSRMIYNIVSGIDPKCKNFVFEKQLSTVIGGKANLDGFITLEENIFVEAKCRELYGPKDNTVSIAYQDFYSYLNDEYSKDKIALNCSYKITKKTKKLKDGSTTSYPVMKVKYFNADKELVNFDIKQMLCHLLGIANAILNESYINDESIKFIYLIYNPENLKFDDESTKKKIKDIRENTIKEALSVITNDLFFAIIKYLQKRTDCKNNINADSFKTKFSFVVCDQTDFKNEIAKDGI